MQTFLDGVCDRHSQVRAILCSDSDGVVLVKSVSSGYQENTIDTTLAAVYASSTLQASKLQFGKNKTLMSWQKDRIIVHVNMAPLFLTIVCAEDSNVGAIIAMAPQIVKALEPIKNAEAAAE